MKNLKKGDTVGVISPAGFIKENENLEIAIKLLKSWGLQVKLGKYVFAKHKHFAGTDTERLDDLQTFLDDDSVNAIWCARGGYGSIRIIDQLDFTKFKVKPKWIIGYSDISIIHQAVQRLGIESIHGIMPTSIESIIKSTVAVNSLYNALFGDKLAYEFKGSKYNKLGKVKGEIVGGNLSLLASLLGTEYALDTTDKIIFIEEIGEYKYRIDSMLQSLKLNNYFKNCKGLVLGSFTKIKINDPSFDTSIEELILEVVKEYNFPVCFDFEAGHIANNNALIFGRKVVLDIREKDVSLVFE